MIYVEKRLYIYDAGSKKVDISYRITTDCHSAGSRRPVNNVASYIALHIALHKALYKALYVALYKALYVALYKALYKALPGLYISLY